MESTTSAKELYCVVEQLDNVVMYVHGPFDTSKACKEYRKYHIHKYGGDSRYFIMRLSHQH